MHIVINAIPTRPGGGLTVVRGLVHSLAHVRSDWKISVLAAHAATRKALAPLVHQSGSIDVDTIPARGGAAAFAWQRWRLAADLRRRGADALIAFNHFFGPTPCPQIIYHLNLCRFLNSVLYDGLRERFKESVRKRAARRALDRADANVFESHYLQRAAEAAIGRPARAAQVAYIGLPDELIRCAERRDDVRATQSSRIVAITSPQPHKDNATIIRMLAALVRRAPGRDWRLDLAGGTDARAWQPLRALAASLGVADRIAWHGFLNQDRLTTLLQSALCLVSTSRLESFAMVPLETMARGCPPIVADCAAMPESVGDAALMARPGDAESFADAVIKLATDGQLRGQLVARGRHWIRGFSWSTCGQTFAQLIESLHAARRASAQRPWRDAA
jgi:glycosyltransferase involved in cell wall biosynthesis